MLTLKVCMTLLKAVTKIILGIKDHLHLRVIVDHCKFWGFLIFFYLVSRSQGGGGVLRISNDSNNRRIFLGLKFSISGCF